MPGTRLVSSDAGEARKKVLVLVWIREARILFLLTEEQLVRHTTLHSISVATLCIGEVKVGDQDLKAEKRLES